MIFRHLGKLNSSRSVVMKGFVSQFEVSNLDRPGREMRGRIGVDSCKVA